MTHPLHGDLDEICGDTESLPEDWKIILTFGDGCLDVELLDPKGELLNVPDPDDEEGPDMTRRMIRRRINFARRSDGLQHAFDLDE